MPEIEKPGGLSYEVRELLPCTALTGTTACHTPVLSCTALLPLAHLSYLSSEQLTAHLEFFSTKYEVTLRGSIKIAQLLCKTCTND